MDFSRRLLPVTEDLFYTEEDYYVWCSSMFKFHDTYYMVYARWEKELGFAAWVTDSKVCLAKADSAFGKFHFVKQLFDYSYPASGENLVIHNPTVMCYGERVYLYYMVTHGKRNWSENRNRQRIGVAYTDDPEGEWVRIPDPVLDVSASGFDSLLVSNPCATQKPDGKILMIYKAVSKDGEMPQGGPVICGAAEADHPLGPFRKYGKPLFVNPNDRWSVEDPCVWYENGKYYVLAKDIHGYFTGIGKASLALFCSENGKDWIPDPENPLGTLCQLVFPDHVIPDIRLDRPQIFFEDGKAVALVCAYQPKPNAEYTYSVRIPMAW